MCSIFRKIFSGLSEYQLERSFGEAIMRELRENDWIVHATHGVGRVKGMEAKNLRGEKRVFYIIKTDKLTYWLPVVNSSTDRIRSVCAPSTFNKALSTIRSKPINLSTAAGPTLPPYY